MATRPLLYKPLHFILQSAKSFLDPHTRKKQPRKRNCHYMDINPQSKEVSLDLARELLIAISQSLPENLINSKFSSNELSNGHSNSAVAANGDIDEVLRSELISIAYGPSPDKVVLPTTGVEE